MEIELKGISWEADIHDVKAEFARILHSDEMKRATINVNNEDRPLNFKVELEGKTENQRHNGNGRLILPNRGIGKKLLELATQEEDFPSIHSRRIRMRESWNRPDKGDVETLRKVPFQNPSIEREHESILAELRTHWRIAKLQFGTWHRRPESPRELEHGRIFAVEWEKDYLVAERNANLTIDYDNKLVKLVLGEPYSDYIVYHALVKFSNIQQLWVGYDIRPYICFDILTPPIFESQEINRTRCDNPFEDSRNSHQRIGALDEHHRRIAPYAYQVRVLLYDQDGLDRFTHCCSVACLRKPVKTNIITEGHYLFSQKMLSEVRKSFSLFRDLPWTVVFQIECLLHNGLLNPLQYLKGLLPRMKILAQSHPAILGTLLRDYAQVLLTGFNNCVDPEDITQHFERFCNARIDFISLEVAARAKREGDGIMACHHVTFTPTRMLLEGPYPIQSNRVLRRYSGFHDHFLRVDFRDEDHLQFRWRHEVDGSTFLKRHVGRILKDGFELAGRRFEFLAYSGSALREHSVWFVSPFHHPEKGLVNAAAIRSEIGDLSQLLATPSKFAARLALAFSSTNPSVKIRRDQWREVPDLGTEPYLHTDGVGTISRELGRQIWQEECRSNPSLRRFAEPSAYQIRFLGYKGVVVIDGSLKGTQMCLRPSMEKFKAHKVDVADIEIANAFYTPTTLYLNRPLVMILEDRGAKKEAFTELLEQAIGNTRLGHDSLEYFVTTMKSHSLGSTFALSSLLSRLSLYGLNLNSKKSPSNLRSPFIDKLVNCTVASVLRDIQYRCRIPVPKSFTLVGVADEGPAWIERGEYAEEEVFTLGEGEIFVCIQKDAESERIYLERQCLVFRSPVVYPGDVQKAWAVAVGKIPDNKACAFRDLINVVVFPSKGKLLGKRSFASCLSGGDLDGDLFNICQYDRIFGNIYDEPAEFSPVEPWKIKLNDLGVNREPGKPMIDQEKIVPYVCDFIVRYINSDVLGLLADEHLIRADQSANGVRDLGCLKLAELCSQAVDYAKNGKEVDISRLPPRLIKYKPDWKQNEADDERRTDFYRSERAVGEIFRKTSEHVASYSGVMSRDESKHHKLSEHPVYTTLRPAVDAKIRDAPVQQTTEDQVRRVFRKYEEELVYICATHTLTDHVGIRLKEEEVVVGTILARCSRHRWRTERIYRMRLHTSNLVKEIRGKFIPDKLEEMPRMEVIKALEFAWTSWKLVTDKLSSEEARKSSFGLNSFSFIALNAVLECLEYLNGQ